jgi:hypothetical protein
VFLCQLFLIGVLFHNAASRSFLIEMVTLAGLEPATSPAPGEQGRSIPLELQRRHDLHDRLWRRRGIGHSGQALAYVYFEDEPGHRSAASKEISGCCVFALIGADIRKVFSSVGAACVSGVLCVLGCAKCTQGKMTKHGGSPISSFSRSSMIVSVGSMSIEPHALARLKSE